MGKVYTVAIANAYFYEARDIIGLRNLTRPVAIREIELSQHSLSGEAAERKLAVSLRYGTAVEPSFSTAVTPIPREVGDPPFYGNAFTNPTAGNTNFFAGGDLKGWWDWNVRGGLFLPFDGDDCPILPPLSSDLMALRLETAPATNFYLSANLVLEVLG